MFGIGMSEMIIILAVALLVFGPDKLPEIAKSISRGLKDLRKASDDLKSSVNLHLDDDEPRMRPRVKPTAGIPGPSTEPGPNIAGSELARDLDPVPALPEGGDVRDTGSHGVPVVKPVMPQAAAGAVARGQPLEEAAPPAPAPASDEEGEAPSAAPAADTHRSS